MGNYKVLFTQAALEDLEEIILYISKDSKNNAIKFHNKIIDKANNLKIFPKLGLLLADKKMRDSGFRMLIIDKYLLFYKIYENEVSILRILHGSRDYPQLFARMQETSEEN